MNRLDYRDWIILIVSSSGYWQFHAASPDQAILTDGYIYVELEVAQKAAQSFVDIAIARLQMSALIDDLQEQGKLTGRDLAQINQSLSDLAVAENGFRAAIALLRLQRSQKTPPAPTDEYPV